MLKLHINTPMQPIASPVRAAVAMPGTLASREAVRPVFYDATNHRRMAIEIASALAIVALMILLTVFAVSVNTAPRLPVTPLPKAAITRTVDGALVQANLLPARRATAGHTTARAQTAPIARPAGPPLASGYITALP
jgi:hypothetical protein